LLVVAVEFLTVQFVQQPVILLVKLLVLVEPVEFFVQFVTVVVLLVQFAERVK